VVNFLDPITKYSNVQGYMFNIRMLKTGSHQQAEATTPPATEPPALDSSSSKHTAAAAAATLLHQQ
jgi:hypothetical protein